MLPFRGTAIRGLGYSAGKHSLNWASISKRGNHYITPRGLDYPESNVSLGLVLMYQFYV
jgi:hypothetical protein